jgi:hypothetical protein
MRAVGLAEARTRASPTYGSIQSVLFPKEQVPVLLPLRSPLRLQAGATYPAPTICFKWMAFPSTTLNNLPDTVHVRARVP